MTTRQWWAKIELRVGQTLPILEMLVTGEDRVTVANLTYYAARAVFSYPNQNPHAVREAIVTDTTNGLVQVRLNGTETPTVGNLIICVDLLAVGCLTKAGQEEWARIGLRPMMAKVLAA